MGILASNNPFPSILVDESTTPASPAAGHQRLYIDSTGLTLRRVNSAGAVTAIEAGRLVGIQILTATSGGTYTPSSGTGSIVLELQGAGGGGAGADGAASNNAVGMSGGAGAYLRKRLTANFSGATYVVGAKGLGGASTNGAGTSGEDTVFTDTAPTVYTAGGGAGGNTGGPSVNFLRPGGAGVGVGGTATNGDINVEGGHAHTSISLAHGFAVSGAGGASLFSPGAESSVIAATNSADAGNHATGRGGGGSGGVCAGTAGAVAGGDGSDGVIVVWEYA